MKNQSFTPHRILNVFTMFVFSLAIIASEMIYFHLLLNVSHYLTATFVVTIAMMGLAIGSIIGYYVQRFDTRLVLILFSLLFLFSMGGAYVNILHIKTLGYPYFLILPFVFGSVIISGIFSLEHSNRIYFVNLFASALGVVVPLLLVPVLKSENTLIVLLLAPTLTIFMLGWYLPSRAGRLMALSGGLLLSLGVSALLLWNLSIPEKYTEEQFQAVRQSIRSFYKGDPALQEYALTILDSAYPWDPSSSHFVLTDQHYERRAGSYLLQRVGLLRRIDILFNIRPQEVLHAEYKVYSTKEPVVLSEDDLMGRIEYLGNGKSLLLGVNGVILDSMSRGQGAYLDPRVPWMDNARVFIVGLSADGIVKSAKRLPGSRVSGIEINPIILRTMQEQGPFSGFAGRPYDNLEVYEGEGRAFLESTTNLYDMITLMNIHMEHGPISTLAPEFFHTVEATDMMLSRLTTRGMIVYEEIILSHRSQLAFYKMLHTWVQSLKERGVADPAQHIMIFSWDFWGGNAFRTVMLKQQPFSGKEIRLYTGFVESLQSSSNYSGVAWLAAPHMALTTTENRIISGLYPQMGTYIPRMLPYKEFQQEIYEPLTEQGRTELEEYFTYNKQYSSYIRKKNISESNVVALLKKSGYPVEVDLSPVYDDKPFPFDVYRNKKEVRSLFQLVLLLSGALLLPVLLLMWVRNRTRQHRLFLPTLFFALTGFGYMLTEIVLMQYFQRFIGNPSYALAVTLGGLLLFSGLGSFFSRNWQRRSLIIALAAVPLMLLIYMLLLDSIFSWFAAAAFHAKLLISILLLLPLTFLMGIPFPHAVESVKERDGAEYGALMFGISGAFSTIASTSSIVISLHHGFTLSFFIGLGCYLAALPLFMKLTRRAG